MPVEASGQSTELVVYCGRGQSLVGPLIDEFQSRTGIQVKVKYAGTAQLAGAIEEEGDRSPADVFWAQDAASLGQLAGAGRFAPLPAELMRNVNPRFRSDSGFWIATSGRARILAYSSRRLDSADLPRSIFDLTDPRWKGRVGWSPGNASFQAWLTAMRLKHGDDRTRQWLIGMKNNGVRSYGTKNLAIIEAIAAGEVDLGLPNHYYLLRKKQQDPHYPVEQTFFEAGDIGNLLLVSGVGVLKTARNSDSALKFIEFLLTPHAAQRFFTGEDMEFTVVQGVANPPQLPGGQALEQIIPHVDLDKLHDLEGTQKLLREVGLL
jgi:iron(III) transport system substrate-binding protein